MVNLGDILLDILLMVVVLFDTLVLLLHSHPFLVVVFLSGTLAHILWVVVVPLKAL